MKYELVYSVSADTAEGMKVFFGKGTLAEKEPCCLRAELPAGTVREISCEIPVAVSPEDRIFMNGFQSWTACPEYRPDEAMQILKAPKPAVRYFGLDRYGDDFFVNPKSETGFFHGESYCYIRSGDRYRLFASLDEDPGYTVFRLSVPEGLLTATRDCAGLDCGGEYPLFDLFYAEGTEQEVFDAWFAAMGIPPCSAKPIAGYCSWYNRYQNIDAAAIANDLAAAETLLQPGDFFQIDDGWEPAVGDWLEADGKKFPAGLKPSADAIHSCGFRAGLWVSPFVVQKGSSLMKEHPDWLLQVDGRPWYCGCNWGGFYSLDFDNPLALNYLKKVFSRLLNEWGFDLLKLDFLYAAAPVNTAKETRAGRMHRAVKLLRELCGEKLILGCGVPLMPAFGLVDYCRIGGDVGLDWDDTLLMQHLHRERVSTCQSLKNTVFRRQLNGRAFLNDPDVFFLREKNLKLTEKQKQQLLTADALLGSVFFTSDNFFACGENAKNRYLAARELRNAEILSVETEPYVTICYESCGSVRALVLDALNE